MTCEELDTLLLSRYPSSSTDDLPSSSSSSSSPASLSSSPNSSSFRAYNSPTISTRVIDFYKEQHEKQTVSSVIEKRTKFSPLNNAKLCAWEALELLNTLIDDSDPDTQLSQIEHCLQTAESLRKDGQPRWLILTGKVSLMFVSP